MRLAQHLLVRRLVEAYLDGELDDRQQRIVRDHLRQCWECGGQLEVLCLVRATLRRRRSDEPVWLPVRRLQRFSRRLSGM